MTGTTKPSGIPWIGEIPLDWETDEIRYKFKQVKSLNFRGAEDNLLSLSYGRIIQKDIESSFGLLPENFDTYNIIENGDIVLRLTDLQNDQKSLRVGFSEQRGIITSAYLTLRLAGKGHAKFFYYLIHAYDLQKVFYGMGAGVRQGINWDEIKRISVILPNEKEQRAIAEFLDRECGLVDAIVLDTMRQIEVLKNHKKSVIGEAVTQGIDRSIPLKDSRNKWIRKVSKDWVITRFKYYRSSANTGESITAEFWDVDGKELLYTAGQEPIRANYESFPQTIRSSEKDLLVARNGAGAIHRPESGAIYTDHVIRFTTTNASRDFLYYALINGMEKVVAEAMDVTLKTLSKSEWDNLAIAMPPLDEQQAIADYLDEKCAEIDSIIKDKQAAVDTMREYKKSLIYEYVTGKKRVREAQ